MLVFVLSRQLGETEMKGGTESVELENKKGGSQNGSQSSMINGGGYLKERERKKRT